VQTSAQIECPKQNSDGASLKRPEKAIHDRVAPPLGAALFNSLGNNPVAEACAV